MNKTFYDYITRQVYAIKFMLTTLREATYDNAEELERVLFEALNALIEFELIFEKINESKGGLK